MGFSHRYSITRIFIGMPLKDNWTEKINLSEKCYHFGRFKLSESEKKKLEIEFFDSVTWWWSCNSCIWNLCACIMTHQLILLTKSTALRHCISILLRHCVLGHFVSVLSQNYSKMALPEKIGKSHDCVPRLLDSGKGKT